VIDLLPINDTLRLLQATHDRLAPGGPFWRKADTLRIGLAIRDIPVLIAEVARLDSDLDGAELELEKQVAANAAAAEQVAGLQIELATAQTRNAELVGVNADLTEQIESMAAEVEHIRHYAAALNRIEGIAKMTRNNWRVDITGGAGR